MANESKTKVAAQGVTDFLDGLDPPERQADARRLVAIFTEVTGYAPRLFSGGMIGFGHYAYTYDSGHSGETFATGFAPRKSEIVLYIGAGTEAQAAVLSTLGKHRLGKGCVYLRRLAGVNEEALRHLIGAGLAAIKSRWTVTADDGR